MKVLALCGSLRRDSVNRLLLQSMQQLALPNIHIEIDDKLGCLPLFNPDLESEPPTIVQDFFVAVAQADGLMIASPEYAHGVTGALKNALDWLVSTFHAINKPVLVLNTSRRANHADSALREILKTMNLRLVGDVSSLVAIQGLNFSVSDIVTSDDFATKIRDALKVLAKEIDFQLIE